MMRSMRTTKSSLLVATLAAVALLVPAAADAACGGVEQMKPQKNVNLGRAPLAIGDSAMLLALPDLAKAGFRANARGCRQYPEAIALLKDLRRKDKLPGVVVIALGSNGPITKENIHDALDVVGKKRTLVLVTPLETGGVAGSDARLVRNEAHKHKRIRMLDWVRFSNGHPGWFQPDQLHLTFPGAAALARLLDDVFKWLPDAH